MCSVGRSKVAAKWYQRFSTKGVRSGALVSRQSPRLAVAEKPASPCLASRIPHLEEVTPEKLAQIDRAEESLRDLSLDYVAEDFLERGILHDSGPEPAGTIAGEGSAS